LPGGSLSRSSYASGIKWGARCRERSNPVDLHAPLTFQDDITLDGVPDPMLPGGGIRGRAMEAAGSSVELDSSRM
jgi:hypothetical protein